MLKQKAVYWAPGGEDSGGSDFDAYGKPMYTNPAEIDCRWEDRVEEFVASDGTRTVSRAVVYVGQDVRTGGVLMLGTLGDIDSGSDPKVNDGAWEIRRFDKLPTLKATKFLRTAYV
jgi:hypothetical protein